MSRFGNTGLGDRPGVSMLGNMSTTGPDPLPDPSGDRPGDRSGEPSRQRSPITHRPARGEGDHGALPDSIENGQVLTELAHELSGLIDGSMRCLRLAAGTFPQGVHQASAEQVESVRRHVGTAVGALHQMVEAIRKSMGPYRTSLGARLGGNGPIALYEAASHAIEVLRLPAAEARTQLSFEVDEAAGAEPAGIVYPLLLNGLRNAIDAVAVTGRGGSVELRVSRPEGGSSIEIEILDDGCGLPNGSHDERLFERGFSTKPDGDGIGLGICRSIVRELGGTIELIDRGLEGTSGTGAALIVRYPAGANRDDNLLPPGGGDAAGDGHG